MLFLQASWTVQRCYYQIFSPQVLTGGRHTLQQGGASLLRSIPDRRLLDALWRPEGWQSDPVAQTTGAPAAVLSGLHPRLRQVNSSRHKLDTQMSSNLTRENKKSLTALHCYNPVSYFLIPDSRYFLCFTWKICRKLTVLNGNYLILGMLGIQEYNGL